MNYVSLDVIGGAQLAHRIEVIEKSIDATSALKQLKTIIDDDIAYLRDMHTMYIEMYIALDSLEYIEDDETMNRIIAVSDALSTIFDEDDEE